ncbi:MAG: GNAT family N-acetyltransferase [Chloroflexota bacterium]
MPTPAFEIRRFDLRSASSEEYARLNAFENILRREILPDDPPVPCSEDTRRWQAMPQLIKEAAWAAWDGAQERILASGQADIYQTGDNPHVIDVKIEVLPEFRRQGMACAMLRHIADHARGQARRLLMTECSDRAPAGGAFLERLGGRKGLDEPVNQLRLADLDRGWLRDGWSAKANFPPSSPLACGRALIRRSTCSA